MGLKFIEPIKSLILLLLVLLSVFLSFSIWNFMPGYETIDKQPAVDISIAAQKRIDEVVKPYKLLFNFDDGLKGTEDTIEIDRVFDSMKQLSIEGLTLNRQKMSIQNITEIMRKPDQLVFFYPDGVPFKVLDAIVPIENSNIPEESFTKMIVNWSSLDNEILQFYFLNDKEKKVYSAQARGVDQKRFTDRLLADAKNYDLYTEIQRTDSLSLYVSQEPPKLPEYTYLLSEVKPDQFKRALFPDPNVVRGNSLSLSTEEYLDDSSKLTVDTSNKWLSYVNPGEESKKGIALPSDLMFNSIDFINEHGGWTDDYRFLKIDPINKDVYFGLTISGQPAFSDTKMKTVIEETWGENDVFKYTRPYFDLGMAFPLENPIKPLPTGKEAADVLASIRELDFRSVEEIKAGYNITISQRQDQRLIIAEPSFYYVVNGNWQRLTPEMLGGGSLGLE